MRIPPPKKRIDTVRLAFPCRIRGNTTRTTPKPTPPTHNRTT
jgi:hypothetical protein